MRGKKIQARFYELPSGRKPVREWLLELNAEDRKTAGQDIQTVEFGWPIGMPICRPLADGLMEVRCSFENGRIGRILFCIVGGEMILLHGFVKKTQKTPPADHMLARKRMKEIK